jgi:TolB-like protein/class 3 adenylate cyclase/tetratricopeptide (TPR) repeat protein
MDRRLAAILIADVVGYSRLSHVDEEGTRIRFLTHLREIFEPKIAEHHGRLIKTMGDGLLVEFPSIVNALRCAIEIQQAESAKNTGLRADQQLQFRIGINLGDVIAEGDDVHGDGVNIADRLQGLADPGGIVISGSAYDHVADKVNIGLQSLGEQSVKNIDKPIRAYRVHLDGSPTKPRVGIGPLPRRVVSLAAIAAILIAIIPLAWWNWSGGHQAAIAEPSIAVLPFKNISGDPGDGRLADGITEDTITDLSRYVDFKVIARNSTEVYKDKPIDIREVGKDLGVNFVLEGSLQRDGDQARITAQLIETATGAHVWSDRFDRPTGEVFSIQSEISDRIANSLGGSTGKVPGHALAAAKRKRPDDLSAYELYLLAHSKIQGVTLENQLEAKRLLERAIELDPSLARAYTMLAWTLAWRMTLEADTAALVKQMLEMGRRAVDLDPNDAEAHQALGFALVFSGDLNEADIEFDKALQLNPNAFDVLANYACMAHNFNKAQLGAEGVDKAMRLNPNYPEWAVPCFRLALVMVGRYEDAVQTQRRQPEENWNADGYVITAGSLVELGQLDEAKALVARGIAKFPHLLTIEKFALNRSWSRDAIPVILNLMRKAGFPACAADADLADTQKPVRLPECVKT